MMDEIKKQTRGIDKGFIIGFIICILVCSLISFLVIQQEMYGLGRDFETYKLVILTDAFTISGGLMCLFYLLVWVSDEGAFDIISYSVQLVWVMTFFRNVRETKLPKTYTEYRELKRSKPRINLSFLLFSGLLFLIIGLIIMIIYYTN